MPIPLVVLQVQDAEIAGRARPLRRTSHCGHARSPGTIDAMTDAGRARSARAFLAVSLLVAGIVLVKHYRLLSADATFYGHDWADIHQVDAVHAARSLAEGDLLPFWTPYIQGGTALYAVPTKPFSYPPFLLAVWLCGPVLGMNLLALLHCALAAAGLLLALRRAGAGALGAGAAALLFVLGDYPGSLFLAAPFWGCAIAWWPWALLCVLNVLEERRPFVAGALLGVVLSLQLHCGGVFPLYWLACFLLPFALPFLARPWTGRGAARLSAAAGLALVVFLGLSAVKLLPALHWLGTCGRAAGLSDEEIFFTYDQMKPYDQGHPVLTILRVMLVAGDRVGVIGLGVLLAAGLVLRLRNRVGLGALLGLFVCLVIASGAVHGLLREVLPGYDRMRMPYRFFFPASLGAILLAGLGADALRRLVARAAGARLAAAFSLLLLAALLYDARVLPLLRFSPRVVHSASERARMAAPVFEAMRDERLSRFQHPVAQDQALWTPLGLHSTTGLLGGEGSENQQYAAWLPFREEPLLLERTCRGVLDVLNTRYIASRQELDFPWLDLAYDSQGGAGERTTDAFVARVAADGTRLEYAGYIGGAGNDSGCGVGVDDQGRAWVAGRAASGGDEDAFAARVSGDGARLEEYARFGGAGAEWGLDVGLDDRGRAVIAGRTASREVALRVAAGGAPPGPSRDWNVFAARLDASGGGVTLERLGAGEPLILEGQGLFGPDVAYVAQGEGAVVTFQTGAVTYLVSRGGPQEGARGADAGRWSLRLDFLGTERAVAPEGRALLAARGHVFKGAPERWRTGIPACGEVCYAGLWPGIDLVFAARDGRLGATFVVSQGADPSRIRLEFQGAAGHALADDGALVLWTPAGSLRTRSPTLRNDDGAEAVAARFWADPPHGAGSFRCGFALGLKKAPSTLFIDSGIEVTQDFPGGAADDYGKAVAVSPSGSVFVAGTTFSSAGKEPPPPGAFPATRDEDADAFIAEFDQGSGALLSWTVLGGNAADFVQGICVDPQGRPCVIGSTRSAEASFPLRVGPSLRFGGVEDAWIARIAADGLSLDYCGYIGGSAGDYGQGVAPGADGRLYVAGDTKSSEASFPVRVGPDLTFNGGADAFVGCVAPDGASFDFLGYVGGDDIDVAYDVAVDAQGCAYLPGVTASSEKTFPVAVGPDLSHNGGRWDAFVAKVEADGARLAYCGFIGGGRVDKGQGIAVDGAGRAHVCGMTQSTEGTFPAAVGPRLARARDGYEEYRAAQDQARDATPFVRPSVYRRTSCLERASVVRDGPILVVGDEESRAAAVREILGQPWFDARQHVLIEDPGPAAGALDREVAEECEALLVAGRAPEEAAALAARAGFAQPAALHGAIPLWVRAEAKTGGGRPARVAPLEARRIEHRARRIEIDLTGIEGRFLLLSELMTQSPGWSAAIDGQEAPLLRAGGLITALRLPPGARRAVFTFTPPGFVAGAILSALSAAALCAAWLRARRGRAS